MIPKMNKVKTGSPRPMKPVSRKTKGPAGGKSPDYCPKSAVKALNQPAPRN